MYIGVHQLLEVEGSVKTVRNSTKWGPGMWHRLGVPVSFLPVEVCASSGAKRVAEILSQTNNRTGNHARSGARHEYEVTEDLHADTLDLLIEEEELQAGQPQRNSGRLPSRVSARSRRARRWRWSPERCAPPPRTPYAGCSLTRRPACSWFPVRWWERRRRRSRWRRRARSASSRYPAVRRGGCRAEAVRATGIKRFINVNIPRAVWKSLIISLTKLFNLRHTILNVTYKNSNLDGVLTHPGKSWNSNWVMKSHGKVMEYIISHGKSWKRNGI